MGKFVISKRTNGEYQFNLKADNGQTILSSEGYAAKAGALNGIESVKKHAPTDSNYDRKTSSNNKYYFNLKASNGQVIGSSQMYESADGMEKGIESVKKNGPGAGNQDETV